ncbi:DUF1659 domain-containing protein [Pontibacillus yanchengensis]|uniref:DUF1659 domain-containing protein n=2 Tax=Pontibacillus yanchengensis TaxID=462910 RepID=A0ACC7VG91_9BACI|nr:DUF1659 domain-containing protein [Pontibacillus yanchengensis]MYL34334.1 DUF1659 domain-containing protein [Pontibacillus yanchengensis]MYL53802.1 DUF1659 domain-containing protein [Pontibacillus yanchengensis]
MAVSNLISSQLQLVFEDGLDDSGRPVLRNKNFNNVKTDATPDQLHAVATAISGLQQRPLHGIERNDASELFES